MRRETNLVCEFHQFSFVSNLFPIEVRQRADLPGDDLQIVPPVDEDQELIIGTGQEHHRMGAEGALARHTQITSALIHRPEALFPHCGNGIQLALDLSCEGSQSIRVEVLRYETSYAQLFFKKWGDDFFLLMFGRNDQSSVLEHSDVRSVIRANLPKE